MTNQAIFILVALLIPLGGLFVAIGIHLALDRAFNLLDGHLERFQAKFDVLVAANSEHNDKLDVILRKLF